MWLGPAIVPIFTHISNTHNLLSVFFFFKNYVVIDSCLVHQDSYRNTVYYFPIQMISSYQQKKVSQGTRNIPTTLLLQIQKKRVKKPLFLMHCPEDMHSTPFPTKGSTKLLTLGQRIRKQVVPVRFSITLMHWNSTSILQKAMLHVPELEKIFPQKNILGPLNGAI